MCTSTWMNSSRKFATITDTEVHLIELNIYLKSVKSFVIIYSSSRILEERLIRGF